MISKINYFAYLEKTYEKKEAQNKIDNIKELIRATVFFEEQGCTTLDSFLHQVSLMQEKIQKHTNEQEGVFLMTLHAAKGLEFDTVILCGLEEGVFPSQQSLFEHDGLEEERRLCYVGITRAKERLLLTFARYRTTYGNTQEQNPSRFFKRTSEPFSSIN